MIPHIRWMIRRDMPEVYAIENAAFERHAWTEEEFIRVLRQRNCIALVAEFDERIVGYTVYELHKTKIDVLNFAVHFDFRRQGVGKAIFRKLAGKLSPSSDRRHKITLTLRESNLDAQCFFRAMGMKSVSVLRDFNLRRCWRTTMNASKETARKATRALEDAAKLLDKYILVNDHRNDVKRKLLQVQDFIGAAERRLPTEAAYDRDAKRRKSK